MSTSPYTLAARAYRWKLRLEVFTKICGGTPCCQCPGCDVWYLGFLQLDHIDGKGAAHRLENKLGTGGAKLWKWARDNGYPPGYFRCFVAIVTVPSLQGPSALYTGSRTAEDPTTKSQSCKPSQRFLPSDESLCCSLRWRVIKRIKSDQLDS